MKVLNFLNSDVLLSFTGIVAPNQKFSESESFKLYENFSPHIKFVESKQNLIDYKNTITAVADSGSSDVVYNEGVDKAAILFNTIFSRAQKSVCIYASRLRDELTMLEPYCLSLLQCVNNGNVGVRILLDQGQADNPTQFKTFLEKYAKEHRNLEIRILDDVANKMRQQTGDDAHFTIADGKMYRIEYDIENFKATASFNSPSVVAHLQKAFDTVWNKAVEE